MKRVVSSSLITLFIIAAVAVAFFYWKNRGISGNTPVQAVPKDAAFFLVANLDEFTPESLLNPGMRKVFGNTGAYTSLEENIHWYDSLLAANDDFKELMGIEPLVISGQMTGATTFDFLYIRSIGKKYNDETIDGLMTTILKPGQHLEMRHYDGITIREVTSGNRIEFAYAVSKDLLLASSTAFLVEDGLRQIKSGKSSVEGFSELEKANNSTGFDLYVNFGNLGTFLSIFTDPSKSSRLNTLDRFAGWSASGIELTEDAIQFKGPVGITDSTGFTGVLTGQEPVELKLPEILPSKTAFFSLTALSNPSVFTEKHRSLYFNDSRKKQSEKLITDVSDAYGIKIDRMMDEWFAGEYALVITEPTGTNYDNNCFAVISAKDASSARKGLDAITKAVSVSDAAKVTEYNSCRMGQIRINHLIPALFGDAFSRIRSSHYAIIGNYVVFANQPSSLRLFIDDFRSGLLLKNTASYKAVRENLPAKGNFVYYIKPNASLNILKSVANEKTLKGLDLNREVFAGTGGICFQISANNTHPYFNAVISFKGGDEVAGVNRIFAVETDSSVSMKPLITSDPKSGVNQILFQDASNTLYLADDAGNVIWKEALSSTIVSEIYQIDLFRNNSRQFLFNTAEHLFLLDEQGKPVGNYPIRLPAQATNGVAVYDFEGNKEPRIYVACQNRSVYAYLPSGKPLPGWSFQPMTGTVSRKIDKVTILGKEYLLINDSEGAVRIVSKFGEPAVSVSEKFVIAQHSIPGQRSDEGVIVTDRGGSVRIIMPDGRVETIPLNIAGSEHGFVFADADGDQSPDFIFIEGKEVTAYNASLTMIYRKEFSHELSGEVQQFQDRAGNKLIALKSSAADLTWLMKPDGNLLPGFPVQGGGVPVLTSFTGDGKLILITGSRENALRAYELD